MNRIAVYSFVLLSIGCTACINQVNKPSEVVKSDESNNIDLQIDTLRKHIEFCDITYRRVDTLPRFPGGNIELAKHIVELYQPIECAKNRLTVIGLLINKKGKVIGGMHKGFVGDCMDQLNAKLGEMLNWIPGYIGGEPVCVQMEINIIGLFDEANKI